MNLILFQFLVSIGGAFSVVGSRVASQASVPHQDMATVIALLSLWTSVGSAIGSAAGSFLLKDLYTQRTENLLSCCNLDVSSRDDANPDAWLIIIHLIVGHYRKT